MMLSPEDERVASASEQGVDALRASLGGRGNVALVDETAVRRWFEQYLTTLSTCGRGESDDLDALLDYYGVPLVMATDDGATALTSADEVIAFARQQVVGMRAANFDRIETIDSAITVLNAASALHVASFARQRADGSEIGRFGVTYLITNGPAGLRISAAAIHSS